jgi:SulP family sulfate permease
VVLSGVFAMGIILLARPLLEKIPIPSLAALIMWLSLKLVHPKHIRVSVFSTYSDALVFLTTFLAAMFLRLDSAVYLGVLVSMALFLQKASEPKLMEFEFDAEGRFRQSQREGKERKPEISIVHVEGELFFGAAESVQEEIWRTVDSKNTKVVILRLRNAQNLDATGVMVLEQLLMDLRRMGVHLLVSGTSPSLDRVMARSGLDAVIGAENYFPSQNNFLDATRRAVKRANELVGVSDPQVRLYYDKDKSKETV